MTTKDMAKIESIITRFEGALNIASVTNDPLEFRLTRCLYKVQEGKHLIKQALVQLGEHKL